jgi:hypothetical protein
MRENSKVRCFVNKSVEVAIWQYHNNHEHLQIEVLVRPGVPGLLTRLRMF